MRIDRELIERLGELSRLQVPAERLPGVVQGLQRLVDAFSALDAADLDPGEATATGPRVESMTPGRLRADQPDPPTGPLVTLDQAPQAAGDCFVVPRVIEP